MEGMGLCFLLASSGFSQRVLKKTRLMLLLFRKWRLFSPE